MLGKLVMIPPATPVTILTAESGRPERVVWDDRSYTVTDVPTLIEPDFALITHVPDAPPAWRFQGTADDDGSTLIFDVRFDLGHHRWELLRTYS
jgi:hypothetical protein